MSLADLDVAVRYGAMRWNAPLSRTHAIELLGALRLHDAETLLDLGCGWGELLLQALERARADGEHVTGDGVDLDEAHIARGRDAAAARGLDAALRFHIAPAAAWTRPADVVLCVGASHAWGGTDRALTALASLVNPGGRLLYGDGCWPAEPAPAAREMFPDVLPLAQVVAAAERARWRVMRRSIASQEEWDEFERSWGAGAAAWLAANPHDARAAGVRRELDERMHEYRAVYRGVLGFCYMVLTR